MLLYPDKYNYIFIQSCRHPRLQQWFIKAIANPLFLKYFSLMKFNYHRHRTSHDRASSSNRVRRRRRSRGSSSEKSKSRSKRERSGGRGHGQHRASPQRNGHIRSSRDRRYSKDRHQEYRHHRDHRDYREPREHKNDRRDTHRNYPKRRSPSSSSSSTSSYSSDASSSISSSTRKRRNTPHYKYKAGEKLGHKYKVTRLLGTGTFGRVLQAENRGELFAIKIIKPVQKYVDSAKTEKNIVKTLNEADPNNRSRIVRFIESFYHYQYYCMVFQPLGPSLYDVIKRNDHNGFPLIIVQSFARQLFQAVGFMHANRYTHTDLKPENILLCTSELKKRPHEQVQNYMLPDDYRVKLIDFGGATHSSERHSSIINTRQYRSPQVILQCCQWQQSSDVWSIACIIPELYTGNLLFPTHDDLEHLLMITKNAKEKLPAWMPKRCKNDLASVFKDGEFDDRIVNKRIKSWADIEELLRVDQIFKNRPELCDLLTRCLQMDPAKRISCEQALKHPFFDVKL